MRGIPMSRFGAVFAALLLAGAAWSPFVVAVEETDIRIEPRPLPAFERTSPDLWINSDPLSVDDLKGQVVLVDVWATTCMKCLRSMPWVHSLETQYGAQGFRVLTVHTPQYPFESNRPRIEAYAKRFGLTAPIYIDHDSAYYKALEAEFWPNFYLIDKQGRIRAHFEGQMEVGSPLSGAAHTVIRELLAEAS